MFANGPAAYIAIRFEALSFLTWFSFGLTNAKGKIANKPTPVDSTLTLWTREIIPWAPSWITNNKNRAIIPCQNGRKKSEPGTFIPGRIGDTVASGDGKKNALTMK